ncbi:DUF302 family protein [Halanaeroarchaeum sp. HSR-CO]|uniref:DUF302 domain-containing protein n=1 Tax=Halanaeroarchaeum sp. HSR-CO TaxID=2866382 RepID=UPI00217D836E|nr:DUF302 domain-containing protein [Halanaeroarchaeum sp. HSR-CO]UWG47708.1 DUF302 family protein [Halanaeroarchaeum sp. HSR-CO]
MTYTHRIERDGEFDEVVEATTEALEQEGFGVLTDVDIQSTMAEKLGEDMRQYRVLGACDPSVAHAGIDAEPELGALLPCNVVVQEMESGRIAVSTVDPTALVGLTGNRDLESAAEGVSARFDSVLEAIDE